jgi:outer membrane cobalamin receptor
MRSLAQILLLIGFGAIAAGCAGMPASNSDEPTVAERQTSTGSRIVEGNPAQSVDVINRDQIDATGANTVEEVLKRKGVNR